MSALVGTSGGIAAAVQAARMGKSAVIVNPTKYLGGLTTGGLGATDIGNKAAIGGLSRDYYHRIAQHYAQDSSWTLETAPDYFAKRRGGQAGASSLSGADATMWTFEPRVAEKVYLQLLAEAKTPVFLEQRLQSVTKVGPQITAITMENGRVFRAKMFVDATYEGDLLAKAGCSFHVGREANATYNETLNGIRAQTPHHQLTVAVDPFVKPGDPASGLLPFIQPGDGGRPGRAEEGSHRLMPLVGWRADRGVRRPVIDQDAREGNPIPGFPSPTKEIGRTVLGGKTRPQWDEGMAPSISRTSAAITPFEPSP